MLHNPGPGLNDKPYTTASKWDSPCFLFEVFARICKGKELMKWEEIQALTGYIEHVINPASDPVIAILIPAAAWKEIFNTVNTLQQDTRFIL